MEETIKYLLFKKEYKLLDNTTGPVFKSQKELAEEIIRLGIGYTQLPSLISFLSQILKTPDQTPNKPIPFRMLKGILDLAQRKLQTSEVEPFAIVIKQAFHESTRDRFAIFTSPHKIWERCLTYVKQKQANTYLFIHTTDLFQWQSLQAAHEFMESVYELLFSNNEENPIIEIDGQVELRRGSLKIYLPTLIMSVEFWKQLLSLTMKKQGISFDKVMLQMKNINQEKLISTFQIDEKECLPPLVYINNLQRKGDIALAKGLFAISLLTEADQISAIAYEPSVVNLWSSKIISLHQQRPKEIEFATIMEFL